MVDRRGFFFFTATSFSFGFKRTRVRVRVLNLVSYFLMDLITLHSSLFPLEWLNNLVDAREGMCWEKFVRRIGSTSIKGNSKLGSCLVEEIFWLASCKALFSPLPIQISLSGLQMIIVYFKVSVSLLVRHCRVKKKIFGISQIICLFERFDRRGFFSMSTSFSFEFQTYSCSCA
ncbi:uncharacterized protein [Aristolochia californica]|uniref:uncharacterized protein isoform X1 n=1 Tax=Aristolochia californica TaxID=171875 RepID=UPI0035E296A1